MKYVKPLIRYMGKSIAESLCQDGSGATAATAAFICNPGSNVSGSSCTSGNVDSSIGCDLGGGPGYTCENGTFASGNSCVTLGAGAGVCNTGGSG